MARTDTLPHFLTDVADAIRTKAGTSETIQASAFDTAIANIPSGGGDYNVAVDTSKTYTTGTSGGIRSLITKVGNIDTSNMTSLNALFAQCYNLTTVSQLNTSSATAFNSMFVNCQQLTTVPLFDTSQGTTFNQMFQQCTNLTTVPQFATDVVRTMSNMFSYCPNLSDASLNNILAMCINTTNKYTGTKNLSYLGINTTDYPASRIQALSNYQAFINAGWTIS